MSGVKDIQDFMIIKQNKFKKENIKFKVMPSFLKKKINLYSLIKGWINCLKD